MLALLSLLLVASARFPQAPEPNVPDRFHILKKNIFILAGQSNMAGRGGVLDDKWDGIVPLECQPNPSILRLSSKLRWEEAHEPLHFDIDVNKTCGVGPGMAFANSVRNADSSIGVVGLVPCAIGGTNISEWTKGSLLYNELVMRTKASLVEGGRIRGFLWYQGESDTLSQVDAEAYRGNLVKFFTDLRDDLLSRRIPIIQVAIASGQGPFIETVRKAQLGLDMPHVSTVDAKGLPLEPDHLHLTTEAQVQLGRMLAEAFLHTSQSSMALVSNAASSRP
ncbi:hypothetical protein GIB67_023498 [Kingdonia uniflora]|uniref:Sialate O-acetylesterase domain-containing protein n=1 Tax=Kingdonia uniflora TaxID=39325 RepID=A0A7J7P9V6_9MAGN|nr:hypothetical protein GIB67_023498 [Kingdonia uniflora]